MFNIQRVCHHETRVCLPGRIQRSSGKAKRQAVQAFDRKPKCEVPYENKHHTKSQHWVIWRYGLLISIYQNAVDQKCYIAYIDL